MTGPITAEWLAGLGFRWHQFGRQPDRQWLLWIGWAFEDDPVDAEDIGIELAPGYDGKWHCWFRSDAGGRYGRFLHLRHLRWREELTELIAGLVGRAFDPAHVHAGMLVTPARAARYRAEADRLDRRLRRDVPWSGDGTDPTQGGALPEHWAITGGLRDG